MFQLHSMRSSLRIAVAMAIAWPAPALADGDCAQRPLTTAEKKAFADAYALFMRVAPKAPDGWASTDHPADGAAPATVCTGSGPVRRNFTRHYSLERGAQEREAAAIQSMTEQAKRQQAQATANRAQIDAIDAQITALIAKVQQAAAAQKFDEVEAINRQMDELGKKKMALLGLDQSVARMEQIEAEQTHDTAATFQLWFEPTSGETRDGKPYRAAAGQALVTAHESKGNPIHDVRVYFGGTPEQARIRVEGDPARVRALMDVTNLQAVATFK